MSVFIVMSIATMLGMAILVGALMLGAKLTELENINK